MAFHSQPNPIAVLKEGKLLSAFRNFCATFNWIASCWQGVRGGNGISVTGVATGQPVVSANIVAGSGVTVTTDSDGAMTISATGGGSDIEAGDGITITEGSSGAKTISADGLTVGGYSGIRKLSFASDSDSNVTFTVTQSGDTATVAVGVHWA